MKITLNGDEKELADGLNLSELLVLIGLDDRLVAVELNRRILPRNEFPGCNLCDGDRLEIVHFVGGG